MPSTPSHGDHVPHELRDKLEALVLGDFDRYWDDEVKPAMPPALRDMLLWGLADRLLDCGDIMPRFLCEELDLPQGSSYASGARVVRDRYRDTYGGDPIVNDPNTFGACPECGDNDGYLNIGRDHWFRCDEHRTTWCFGSNLFSSSQYETEDIWRENAAQLADYRIVEKMIR